MIISNSKMKTTNLYSRETNMKKKKQIRKATTSVCFISSLAGAWFEFHFRPVAAIIH